MGRLSWRIVAALWLLAASVYSESSDECQQNQFKCSCGFPRCIDVELVGDGTPDCKDGSDEGYGLLCTEEDELQDMVDLERKRRSSDFRIEVNEGQTTTYYLRNTAVRGRALGLITSAKGVFVNAETTTLYATEILGSLIDGTYARIQSTTSRVFSALETQEPEFQTTGIVSSTVITRIRGETTTVEQTDFVHTFIDGTYAKEILSTTNVFAPLHATHKIQPSAVQPVISTVEVEGSKSSTDEDGKIIFQKAHLTQIVGERVISPSMSSILDEDKVTEEDSKKLITSFTEAVIDDNNLRARKELDLNEETDLSPSKPKVAAALPTVRPGESLDEILAAAEKTASPTEMGTEFQAAVSSAVVEKGLGDIANLQDDQKEIMTNDGLVTAFYSGFSDFTTSIGNTLVIFSPSSAVLDAKVEPTSISSVETTSQPENDQVTTEEPEIRATVEKSDEVAVEPIIKASHVEHLDSAGVTVTAIAAGNDNQDQGHEQIEKETHGTPFLVIAASPESDPTTDTPSTESTVEENGDKEQAPVRAESKSERGRKISSFPDEQVIAGSLSDADLSEADKATPTANLVKYTFYTTLFLPEGITSISSREVVSTEIDVSEESTLPAEAVEPTVIQEQQPNKIEPTPSVTTLFTTYTYYTTFFDDRTTKMLTREEVVSNVVTLSDNVTPSVEPSMMVDELKVDITPTASVNIFNSITEGLLKTLLTTYTSFTTALVDGTTTVFSNTEVFTNVVTPSVTLTDLSEELLEAVKKDDKGEDFLSLQEVLDTASRKLETSISPSTVEIEPAPVSTAEEAETNIPAVVESEKETTATESLLKTFYTTLTYFTTFFTEGTSDIVSREETITNVVSDATDLVEPTEGASLVFPITYYTTYTYWTTSYSDDQTFINSREETVSNVVTPGAAESTEVIAPTEIVQLDATSAPAALAHATTFYTTYTYITTTFDGDSTVISSSFETVTNIVTGTTSSAIEPTATVSLESTLNSARAVGTVNAVEQLLEETTTPTEIPADIQPTGLLSTIRSTEVEDGTTTLFTTEVIGTFINGQYATLVESSSEVIPPQEITVNAVPEAPTTASTGVLSVDIATAFDVGSPTTTVFTSRAIGTLIGNLYAQVIETTSSLRINPEVVPSEDPDAFKTGVIRSITGSIVKNSETTAYESRIIGTFVDGLYAQIIESSSVVVTPTVAVVASEVTTVEPTELPPIIIPSSVIESSIQSSVEPTEETDDDESGKTGKSRVKTRLSLSARPRTFTPSIRPFTQRTRPAFALKKKRPPFTGANTTDDNANSILPASPFEVEATETSSSRTTLNRFKQTSTSTPSATETSESSKNRLFKSRTSVSPLPSSSVPVSKFSSSFASGRRISSSAITSSSFARSSTGGVAFVRSSTLSVSSRGRVSSGIPSLRSSILPSGVSSRVRSSIIPTATSNRLESIESSTPESSPTEIQETSEEPQTTVAAKSTTRRPLFRPVANEPKQETSSAPVSTKRQFPLSRASSLRALSQKTAEESKVEEQTVPTTSKPRFVRPPKLTFTERSRNTLPARRLFKQPGTQNDEEPEESVVDEVVVRNKRGTHDYDYEFYDRTHYRRPSRGSSQRSRTRPAAEPDYFDYDATEEEPVTSSRGRPASFRDRVTSSRQGSTTASRPSTRPRPSSPSRGSEFTLTNRQTSSGSRFRKPQPDTPSSSRPSSFRRPDGSSSSRPKTSSRVTATTEKPSTGRRFGSSPRRGSGRPKAPAENDIRDKQEPVQVVQREPAGPGLAPTITVTHYVPAETTIPVVNGKVTEIKTIVTAKPSTEVLTHYSSSKIQGSWRFIASEISSTPQIGVTEITQYFIKPTETSTVEFTPTVIRGRQTSFSHIVPSTIYDIEPVVSTITDPVASTNSLLQQLLLGGLGGLQQNPLLGNLGAPATPTTSYNTFTTTYVTTLTDLKSTILPITLRGIEIFTTIVASSTSVITATEFSTQTIVITPTQAVQAPAFQPNPLASLLPALLGNPLLQAQLLNQPQPVLPTIPQTQAPAILSTEIPTLNSKRESLPSDEEELEELVEQISPDRPVPVTSVVTLFLSGRRPGEFSSVLSTITLDGPEASVVKRQTSPSQVAEILEYSALPVMVGTDKGIYELPENYEAQDLDYYVMSAINEVGTEVASDAEGTESLEKVVDISKYTEPHRVRKVRQVSEETQDDVAPVSPKSVVRKTVIVTKKRPVSPAPSDTPFEPSPENRRRKVVVVTRRKSVAKAIDEAEQINNLEPEKEVQSSTEPSTGTKRRVVVVTKKKAVPQAVVTENVPVIESSKDESILSRAFGDVYAPRTYYTVYSYLYTILNGRNSGDVSSREVTISELVRGTDSRIPSAFARTENAVGLYTLSSGEQVADLGTRVTNGVTTQVNLASVTLVKYGRGPVKTKSAVNEKVVETSSRQAIRGSTRIAPTARIEPSFDAHLDEETPIVRTQQLPSKTRGRGTKTTKVQVATDSVTEAVSSSTRKTSRGRGTVRFAAGVSPTAERESVSVSSVKVNRKPQKVQPVKPVEEKFTNEEPDYGHDDYHDDRNDLDSDYEDHPQEHHDDYFDEPNHDEPIHDEPFHDEPHYDDEPLDEDYRDDEHHEDEEYHDHEEQHDDFEQEEPVEPEVSPSTTTETPLVKPTRFTISRKLVNPLESHLSSIRAQSRLLASSRGTSEQTASVSPIPFRARLAQRLSSTVVSTPRNSTVVYKTFSTTSTLPVDGRRSGIQITLVTSSLTTLFDEEIRLVTESPEIFKPFVQPTSLPSRLSSFRFNPSTRTNIPFFSSLRASSSSVLPAPEVIVGSLEDSSATEEPSTETVPETTEATFVADGETPSSTELSSSIDDEVTTPNVVSVSLATPRLTITKVETELRTFTAIVTRKSGDEEEVTTRTEVIPEVITKTLVVDPTEVPDEQSFSLDENILPTARAVPAGLGNQREARLNIVNNSRQNLATKVMSNGVEVIVAGDRKPTLLAQEVIKATETISPSVPVTLAPSVIQNQVAVGTDIENVHLLSSIQSDTAQFATHTHLATLTYLTTLLDGNSTVVSKRQEVITNVVTRETGAEVTPTAAPELTLSGEFQKPDYQTLTYFTTFTYLNTFTDVNRPVVLTSRETISNMVTVPVTDSEISSPETLFNTNTYLRTYTFSKTMQDQVVTTQEVVTQIVVTEAPKVIIRPTAVVDSAAEIEPTPLIEGSKSELTDEQPLIATKTYFTTSTLFTTLLEGTKTVVVSRTEVASSVATETIGLDLFSKSLLAPQTDSIEPSILEDAATETLAGTDELTAADVSSKPVAGAADAVIKVTNTAGEVIVVPTELLAAETPEKSAVQTSTTTTTEKGGLGAFLSSLGLSVLRQGLASNDKGGLKLGSVIDAMSGIISSSFAGRRNDSSSQQVPKNPLPQQPVPLREPQFIPISNAEPFIPAQNPQARIPIQTNIVPIQQQRPPAPLPVRRPEPGVPLVPAAPGSPLLRPGAVVLEEQRPPQPSKEFGVIQVIPGRPLTQLPGQPVPIQINVNPPVQTGFTGIANIPIPVPTRVVPVATTGFPGNRPPPPPPAIAPFVPGKNNIDRVEVQPTAPLNMPLPSAQAQFFAANGQPVVVPPPPPGPVAQRPVESLPQGSIVLGPDGVPVKIIAVPEGQAPPPGAEGQVFIRPAIAPPRPVVFDTPRPERPQTPPKVPLPPQLVSELATRREDSLLLSTERPVLPSFQLPAVQTIASIEGDNKIVSTRIISNGQAIEVQPTEIEVLPQVFPTAPVAIQPTAIVGIAPTILLESFTLPVTTGSPVAVPEVEESNEEVEVVGNVLQPTASQPSQPEETPEIVDEIAPQPTASEAPQVEGTLETVDDSDSQPETPEVPEIEETEEVVDDIVVQPTASQVPEVEGTMGVVDEVTSELEAEVAQTTPRLEITSETVPVVPVVTETSSDIVVESSTVVFAPETTVEVIPETVAPEITEKSSEPFGITSVIMGPEEVFTTFATRTEGEGQTVVSTIVGQVTEVNSVTPTAIVELPESEEEIESQADKFTQEPERSSVPSFPEDSPFNPPTPAPAALPSTAQSSTTVSTTQASVKETVQDENKDNKFVVAGFGGHFGVNQPSSTSECKCGNLETCEKKPEGNVCVCKSGYIRSAPNQPCRKSYAYQLSLVLERANDTMLHYDENLSNSLSPQYRSLASAAKDGLHQTFMKTNISNMAFKSQVMAIHPVTKMNTNMDGVLVDFIVELPEQHDEQILSNQLIKSLEANNFGLGESQIFAAPFTDSLQAQDFDECTHAEYNDCSEFATCVNEKGSYKCECKPGFVDSSDGTGRICLAELKDCEKCNRNGRCVFQPEKNEMECVCNYWFAGSECQVNLKVLMIVILAVGSLVALLVIGLVVICCLRSRRAKGAISAGPSFLRYKGSNGPTSGTLDRAAMIRGDTSSESSGGAGADNFGASSTLDNKGNKGAAGPSLQSYRPYGEGMMIPRVKHHSPTNKASAAERGESAKREQQLIEYLENKRKNSEERERSTSMDNLSKSRSSEALANAGRSSVSSLSQFRSSLEDAEAGHEDTDKILEQTPDEMTVSEVRSYDETTIRPAVKRAPNKYYQSDVMEDVWSPSYSPAHYLSTRPVPYTSFRDSDNNSNFDSF